MGFIFSPIEYTVRKSKVDDIFASVAKNLAIKSSPELSLAQHICFIVI